MGKRICPKLERIDHNRPISRETDRMFLHGLYSSLLLALKEQGRLNEVQYRRAVEALKRQL